MKRKPNLIKSAMETGGMSECSVGGNEKVQKECEFRKKSRNSDKCMYCVMGDEICDSIEAQKDAEGALAGGKATPEKPEENIETQYIPPEKKLKPSKGKISFE